ncbi:hypothetical protein HYU09_04270 [Candidatus Woesearchaeota archaeon]|nr:hypothetical protein [Candidatus Woesearchaeota archaeon]
MANRRIVGGSVAGIGAAAAIVSGLYLWGANQRQQDLLDAIDAKNTAQQELSMADGRMTALDKAIKGEIDNFKTASDEFDSASSNLTSAQNEESQAASAQNEAKAQFNAQTLRVKDAETNYISAENQMKKLEGLVADFRAKKTSAEADMKNAFGSYQVTETNYKNLDKTVLEKRAELKQAVSLKDKQQEKYNAANEHLERLTKLVKSTESSLDDAIKNMNNTGEDIYSKLSRLNELEKSQHKGVQKGDSLWRMVGKAYVLAYGDVPSNQQIMDLVNLVAKANNMMTPTEFDKYVKEKYAHINLDGINYSRLQEAGNPHRILPGQILNLSVILNGAISNSEKIVAEAEEAHVASIEKAGSLENQLEGLETKLAGAEKAYNSQDIAYTTAVTRVSETTAKLTQLETQLKDARQIYDAAKSAYEAAKSKAEEMAGKYKSAQADSNAFEPEYESVLSTKGTAEAQLGLKTDNLAAADDTLNNAREALAKAQSSFKAEKADLKKAQEELNAANEAMASFKPEYNQKYNASTGAIRAYQDAERNAPSKGGVLAGYMGSIGGGIATLIGAVLALYRRRKESNPDGTPNGNGSSTPEGPGEGDKELGAVVNEGSVGNGSTSGPSGYLGANVVAVDFGQGSRYDRLKADHEIATRYKSEHKRPNTRFASTLQDTFNLLYDNDGKITMSAKDAADKFGVSISTIYRRTRLIASLLEDNTLTYGNNLKNVYSSLEKAASPSLAGQLPMATSQKLAA